MMPSLTDQANSEMTIDWSYLQVDLLNIFSGHLNPKSLRVHVQCALFFAL